MIVLFSHNKPCVFHKSTQIVYPPWHILLSTHLRWTIYRMRSFRTLCFQSFNVFEVLSFNILIDRCKACLAWLAMYLHCNLLGTSRLLTWCRSTISTAILEFASDFASEFAFEFAFTASLLEDSEWIGRNPIPGGRLDESRECSI